MPTTKITKEEVHEFFKLTEKGMSQAKASESLGYGKESMRKAAQRLNIPWKKSLYRRNQIKDAILARRQEIIESSEKQRYWAEEFKTTQAYISAVFKKLGITKASRKHHQGNYGGNKVDIARKVIGYIAENGGNVLNALKVLNLHTSQPQHIRDFAKAVGFNLKEYVYAWRTYGDWITIPGPIKHLNPYQNVEVPAVCTRCGNIKALNLTNAKTGRTHSCAACAAGHGRKFKVVNTETGEEYRSIMAFANAHGLSGRYQTARVSLITNGSYIFKDVEYRLMPRK